MIVITADRTYSFDGCGTTWQFLTEDDKWTMNSNKVRVFATITEAEEFLKNNPPPEQDENGMVTVEGPFVKEFD